MRKTTFVVLFVALLALAAVASAAMPDSVQVITTKFGTLDDYADANIVSGGNEDLADSPPIYLGWCVDTQGVLYNGVSPVQTRIPYSTLEAVPNNVKPADWQAINYIINHKGSASRYQVQTAIWQLTSTGVGHHWNVPVDDAGVQALLTDAANHASWQPGEGDLYGVILWQEGQAQAILIEVPLGKIYIPEFPTLALPVAMILGMVFSVYTVKRHED